MRPLGQNLEPILSDFQRSIGHVRLLLIVSPT